MQLTQYSDYSMRVLIYLVQHKGKLCTIDEISDYYNISRNHLMKVVNHLVNAKFIESVRGRSGGIRLISDPREISIGAVIRSTESGFNLVECFNPRKQDCAAIPVCKFNYILATAFQEFMKVLDNSTLADALQTKTQ